MKAVILAGGYGTRISEETHLRPKPMIEIGGHPILWHIMKGYSAAGINDFVICCGYKGYVIKEFFANYLLHGSDITFHLDEDRIEVHQRRNEPWKVTLVDTGADTMTGGRLKRVAGHLSGTFCLTYGDGLADLDIADLIAFHRIRGAEATVTAVQPVGRYGAMEIEGARALSFNEKPKGDGHWVNGGFFVCEPSVLARIEGDDTHWEREPLESLARDGALSVYRHEGFWAAMDTLRDKTRLEALWESGAAPWRQWL